MTSNIYYISSVPSNHILYQDSGIPDTKHGFIIPFVVSFIATPIASAIGLSHAIGTFAASAMVGAVLGGIAGEVAGVGWEKAALAGAIGGGASGYVSAGGFTGTAASNAAGLNLPNTGVPGTTPANVGVPGMGSPIPTPTTLAGNTANTVNTVNTVNTNNPSYWASLKQSFSPKNLADLTVQAGSQLLGQYVFQGDMSEGQKALLAQRQKELQELKNKDEAAFKLQYTEAKKFLAQAEYYDPTYGGVLALNKENIRQARSESEGKRNASFTGRGFTTGDERRASIARTRSVGGAYDRGFTSALNKQTEVKRAVLSSIPSASTNYSAGLTDLYNSYSALATGNANKAENFSNLVGDFYGFGRTSDEDEDEDEDA